MNGDSGLLPVPWKFYGRRLLELDGHLAAMAEMDLPAAIYMEVALGPQHPTAARHESLKARP